LNLIHLISNQPRRVLGFVALGSIALLAFGLYLQHVVGLEPCPMCIVQRYLLVLVALVAGMGAAVPSTAKGGRGFAAVLLLLALTGAFVAARQSWLQWFPPQVYACGRDLYGMIEAFPLKRVIPMVFKGSGDCAAVDWTFLRLSIANWSFLNFALIGTLAALLLRRRRSAF